MIARILASPHGGLSRFAGLVRYVTRDRALDAESILAPMVACLATAAAEMAFVAAQADVRTNDPCLHLVVSWTRDERPSLDEVEDTAVTLMASLGLDEHQWLATRHSDTRVTHAHIVANRVNPASHRTVNQIGNGRTAMRAARLLEYEHGWQPAGGPFRVEVREDGSPEVVDVRALLRRDRAALGTGAAASSARAGVPSFQDWIGNAVSRAAAQTLTTPGVTWQRLHASLARYGVEYTVVAHGRRRGGMVLDRGQSRWQAKASHLGRFAALPALERALGAFESAPIRGLPEPVSTYMDHIGHSPRTTGARASYTRYRAAVRAHNAQVTASLRGSRLGPAGASAAQPVGSDAAARRRRAVVRHELKTRIAQASEPVLSFAEWRRRNGRSGGGGATLEVIGSAPTGGERVPRRSATLQTVGYQIVDGARSLAYTWAGAIAFEDKGDRVVLHASEDQHRVAARELCTEKWQRLDVSRSAPREHVNASALRWLAAVQDTCRALALAPAVAVESVETSAMVHLATNDAERRALVEAHAKDGGLDRTADFDAATLLAVRLRVTGHEAADVATMLAARYGTETVAPACERASSEQGDALVRAMAVDRYRLQALAGAALQAVRTRPSLELVTAPARARATRGAPAAMRFALHDGQRISGSFMGVRADEQGQFALIRRVDASIAWVRMESEDARQLRGIADGEQIDLLRDARTHHLRAQRVKQLARGDEFAR